MCEFTIPARIVGMYLSGLGNFELGKLDSFWRTLALDPSFLRIYGKISRDG